MNKNTKKREIKLVPIGNSKGIRLTKSILQRYGFSDTVLLEETDEGVFLSSKGSKKSSWEESYKSMANQPEDWSDFDSTLLDGIDE